MVNVEVANNLSFIVGGDEHDRGITNKFDSLQVPGDGEIWVHDGNLSTFDFAFVSIRCSGMIIDVKGTWV
jgi:hypothetical protein